VNEIYFYFLRFYSNSGNVRYLNVHKCLPSDIKIREADGVKVILQKVNEFLANFVHFFISELDTIQHRRRSQRFVS
jgi:hypothetical protein